MLSAQSFFRSAVAQPGVRWPAKINLDGNSATHLGLRLLGEEDSRWRKVEVRARRYLNNVVEQDHRAIKQRCAPMLRLKSFRSAAITLAGVELVNAPELTESISWWEWTPTWSRSISPKDLLWRQSLSTAYAEGRAILAVRLSVWREAEDAFSWDLSGRADQSRSVATLGRPSVARSGRGSVPLKIGLAACSGALMGARGAQAN